MASTIITKNGTGSASPSSLQQGELAINVDNGKLFYGTSGSSNSVSSSFTFDDLIVTNLTSTNFTSSIITSSIIITSGSNIFGDGSSDTHTFNGAITASSDISSSETITSNAGVITTLTSTNVTASSITSSGTITANSLVGPLATAAQPNITSVGTLTNLIVDNVQINSNAINSTSDTDVFITIGTAGLGFEANNGDKFEFNSAQNNVDFKYNGESDGNLLYIDASTDKVGIGVSTPGEKLTVTGNISSSGTIVGSNLSGTNTGDQDLSSYSTIVQLNASSSTLQTNIDAKAPIANPSFTSNVTASGNISASGEIEANTFKAAGNVDFNGDLDVDGTTNLDTVDIDGNVQLDGTLTIGENDQGYDVTLFGNTSNKYIKWDTSMDHLKLYDNTNLVFGTGQFNEADYDASIFWDTADLVIDSETDIKIVADGGSVDVTGQITSSGNISSSGTIVGSNLSGTNTGDQNISNLAITGSDVIFANITASGNISSSGDIYANETFLDNGGSVYFGQGTSNEVRLRGVSGELLILSSSNVGIRINPGAGHITASGNISSSGTITAEHFYSSDDAEITDDLTVNGDIFANGSIVGDGNTSLSGMKHITASGNISSSGNLITTTLQFTGTDTSEDATHYLEFKKPGNTVSNITNGVTINPSSDTLVLGGTTTIAGQAGTITGLTSLTSTNITASGNISSSGTVTANTLRLSSTTDASVSSTGHAFQAGLTNSTNVIMDNNEIMARNNGAVSNLHLNPDGGIITFNNSVSDKVIINSGNITASGNISSSGTISGQAGLLVHSKSSAVGADAQGDVVYFGGGSGLTTGSICHYNSSGNWELADADAASTSDGLLGVTLATAPSGGILLRGMVTLDHDPGAVGDVLYVSTTAGDATATAPSGNGDIVRIIGYCLDASNGQIWFNPDSTFVEVNA